MSTPIAHKDDYKSINDLPKGAVICGVSGLVFANNEDYLAHESPVTGFKPTEPEHHGRRFVKQQRQALLRGLNKNRKKKRTELPTKLEKELEKTEANIARKNVDNKLAEEKARPKKRKGKRN